MTVRTVLTLRARLLSGEPPRTGELMASASGRTVYRVVAVTTVRTAGDPLGTRYRLACGRLLQAEVPGGVTIHPWKWDRRAPPQAPQGTPRRPMAATGTAPDTQNGCSTPSRPRTRVVAERAVFDLGPGLRRRALRDRTGRLLREADVQVDEQATDPRNPNRRLRRAYRVDPVDILRRAGSLGAREADAAAELRRHMERMWPTMSGIGAGVSVQAFVTQPITDEHIRASRKLREASTALGELLWPPVLWVCLGGSIRGYAAQRRMRERAAWGLVQHGFHRLADHFYGRAA